MIWHLQAALIADAVTRIAAAAAALVVELTR